MLAYLDSSVLLRKVFGEPDPLPELGAITYAVSSELIQVECLRTADRFRLSNDQSEDDYLERVDLIRDSLKRLELIRVSPEILNRASAPFPSSLGTLDAIHLATCLAYQERQPDPSHELVLCTHDGALRKAARAMGLRVLG